MNPFSPWPILRKSKASTVPPDICATGEGSEFQAFEVLLTRIAALIEPGYSFAASPEKHDRGIDFIGTRHLFTIPKFSLEQVSVIAGQCKARDDGSKAKTAEVEFRSDPMKMVSTVKKRYGSRPALVILATSGKMTIDQRNAVKEDWGDVLIAPIMFLTGEELEYLISENLKYLQPVFDHFLAGESRQRVVDYFQALRPRTPAVSIEVLSAESAETAQPFVVPIRIEALPIGDLRIRWRYSALREREILREITPPRIAHDQGIPLAARHGTTQLELKLVGYSAGTHDLGVIEVLRDGERIAEASLGSVELLEAYHPPFVRGPYEAHLSNFASWLQSAELGHVHVASVTGLGGTGKSRLCGEFGYLVEQEEGRWLSLSHPQTSDDPYALLVHLSSALVPGAREAGESPAERVLRYLSEVHVKLAARAEPLIGLTHNDAPHTEPPRKVFADILTVLLLTAASDQLLGIHLSDLHWSDSLVLEVLSDVVERLRGIRGDRSARVDFPIRLMLVLEGRRMEARLAGRGGAQANTVAWETFVENRPDAVLDHHIEVTPMSEADSIQFVEHVFASTDTSDTPIPRELIPHQRLLIETIQRRADGTPLFVTEYIRLLRAQKHLGVTRSGLVYLSRELEGPIVIPANVDEIIANRFAYLEKLLPDAALLVRAVGFIKDRVSRSLYERLRAEVAPRATDAMVASTDFVRLPAAMQESVAFRHESYYARLRCVELTVDQRRQISDIYLAWLRDQLQTASAVFDRGLVFEQSPDATLADLDEAFRDALSLAQLQPLLAMRILEHIVRLYPRDVAGLRELEPERFIGYLDLQLNLLRAATNACNWPLAHQQVDTLMAATDAIAGAGWPGTALERSIVQRRRAEAQMQLVNISLHQMRYDVSIAVAEELLRDLQVAPRDNAADWQRIMAETENRFGIALKMDGQFDRALRELERAVEIARELRDEPLELFWTIDLGAALLHVDRHRGMATLRDAYAKANRRESEAASIWEAVRLMADIHLAAGELTDAPNADPEAILQRMERVSKVAQLNGWGWDVAASSSIAGTCAAILRRHSEAARWLMNVVDIGVRDHHYSFLWKGHVNLAQLCFDSMPGQLGADLHAQEAERFIRDDIAGTTGVASQRKRASYAGPLAQLHRVWSGLNDERAERIAADFPEIAGKWEDRAALHAPVPPGVFFFMN